jgi:hypothetical protein
MGHDSGNVAPMPKSATAQCKFAFSSYRYNTAAAGVKVSYKVQLVSSYRQAPLAEAGRVGSVDL